MKKILSIIICCFSPLLYINADDINLKPTHSTDVQQKRTPIRTPDASIEDHTLTFDSSCIGCTITLLQDDIIIYSATVEENDNMEGEVVLPDYLTGMFELQLEIGSITFVGEIEL